MTEDRRSQGKGPGEHDRDDRVRRALAEWPPQDAEATRLASGQSWDQAAEQVVSRLSGRHLSGRPSETRSRAPLGQESNDPHDALLAAPLPAEADEPDERPVGLRTGEKSLTPGKKSTMDDVPGRRPESIAPPSSGIVREVAKMTQSEQRVRERTSFKDLAKLAATPPPPSSSLASPLSGAGAGPGSRRGAAADTSGELGPRSSAGPVSQRLDPNDSGMVDLKTIASLDPRGAERAKTTPLASSGLFDDDSPVSQAPYSGQLSGQVSGPLSGRVSDRGSLSAPPPPSSVEGLGRPSIPSERPPMVAHASAQAESAPMSLRPHGYVSQPPPSVTGFVGAPVSARAMMGSDSALPTKKKSSGGILLLVGGVVTLAAAAAGGVFYMKSHDKSLASSKAPSAVVETAPVVAPAVTMPATTPAAATVATNDAVPAVDDAVSPDSLAVGSKDSPVAAKGAKHAVAAKPAAKAGPKAVEPAAAAATTKKPEAKVAATAPTSAGELGAAMQKAAGPADAVAVEEKAAGPQFAPGSVPQKPANGTVMGAIGAALPGARACLGPDDPVSRATITFQSTGAVQSVNVSGGAAGKPAEACIKTALGKAKVPPFAEATFTTAVTVRP